MSQLRYEMRPWLRNPKTTQERRVNGKRCKWSRPRRSAANLPNAWDDIPIRYQKSWKKKRKTQYRPGGRGQQHDLYFHATQKWGYWRDDAWLQVHAIEEYFKKQDIPCVLEHDYESYCKVYVTTHHWVLSTKEYPCDRYTEANERYTYWHRVWEWVPLAKPIYRYRWFSNLKGYKLTYWTNKNIDINRIGYALR